jgi:hypothetical protein
MRYLYTADDDQLFAHAPGRRDFFKEGDDRVWAHESHGWLVAAESGQTLAHRTGDVYYSAVDGKRLYRLSAEGKSESEGIPVDSEVGTRGRRSSPRAVRPRL